MRKYLKYSLFLAFLVLPLVACGGQGTTSASDQAQRGSASLQSQIYISHHNIEFQNYNLRQKMADDPSTILWCTFFPPTMGQEPFTVPIAGKLTSSNKRPYQSTRYEADSNGVYAYENAGPDKMYGSSSEYRYGFDPTRTIYYDFTSLASFCTNEPTVWQKNQTNVVIQTDTTLNSLDRAAQQALRAGHAAQALSLLKKADSSQKGGK